ncbi:MAG TPA: hypothetical protein VIM41_01720 [Gammaproteobacteria bacterium]
MHRQMPNGRTQPGESNTFVVKQLMTFRIPRMLIPVLLLVAASGCSSLGIKYPEMRGRVLHEIHDTPIPATTVVALWRGKPNTTAGVKAICYHVETTVSNEKGLFTIPAWRESGEFNDLAEKAVHVYAYRKTYRASELTSQIITPKNYIYYLAKPRALDDETVARQERLRYLQLLVGDTLCDLEGKSRGNLQPMYTAIVQEAEELAVTEQDREVVQKIKSWLSFVTASGN